MVDRQWFGDLARAILIALPLALLARPAAATINSLGSHHQMHFNMHGSGGGRISLLG